MLKAAGGFSLTELVAVIIILGVLSAVVASRFTGTEAMQLQASRDSVVTALFVAQQRAMTQTGDVQVVTSGSQVDIQQFDGSAYQSINVGNVQYPLTLSANQTISSHTLDYDRLGRTTATDLVLSQSGSSVTINVSASGFSQ